MCTDKKRDFFLLGKSEYGGKVLSVSGGTGCCFTLFRFSAQEGTLGDLCSSGYAENKQVSEGGSKIDSFNIL